MYWEEDDQNNTNMADNNIVDVSFKVDCKKIAADHSYNLFEAVLKRFPQINDINNLLSLTTIENMDLLNGLSK